MRFPPPQGTVLWEKHKLPLAGKELCYHGLFLQVTLGKRHFGDYVVKKGINWLSHADWGVLGVGSPQILTVAKVEKHDYTKAFNHTSKAS